MQSLTIRILVIALGLVAPANAVTLATGTFTVALWDVEGNSYDGSLTFDDQTFDVFGTPVNLGQSVGSMNITGRLTSYAPATSSGSYINVNTTLPMGCFPRLGLSDCEGCACEACVCALDSSCCTSPSGDWTSACVNTCQTTCSQSCPSLALSIEAVNGLFTCRDASGTQPANCTTVGDTSYFGAGATFQGTVAATLPANLQYTFNGTAIFDSTMPGVVRYSSGQFTVSAFQETTPVGTAPCIGAPTICDDNDPSTIDSCHPLLNCQHFGDGDGDGVSEDGDASGIVGDEPCDPGQSVGCDDNCPQAANANQADYDLDGAGDICDDSDGDALFDAWEIVGLPGVNLPAMGADPAHKDIFIEVDWMEGWSCQLSNCQGGTNNGAWCDTDANCTGGGRCFNCTCDPSSCSNCVAGSNICTALDAANGNECTCPPGTVDECVDSASCGPTGRCVFHSHKPTATCLGGVNKNDLCTTDGDCPSSVCMSAMERVAQVFAMAPVDNPDGQTGVTLHVDTGELGGGTAIPHKENLNFHSGVGSPNAFSSKKACYFNFARAPVFHYAIFAHDYDECVSYGGVSEGFGVGDFLMTMGSWLNEEGQMIGDVPGQTATFVHELGHNLGLGHGGAINEPNYKPNYLSVMNYLYPTQMSGRYDYSRSTLPSPSGFLDEAALDESQGLAGHNVVRDGPLFYSCERRGCPQVPASTCSCPTPGVGCFGVPACTDSLNTGGFCGCFGATVFPGPVDWNCDGTIAPLPIATEINHGDSDDFNGRFQCPILAAPRQQRLHGFNDWANIKYNFRESLYDTQPAVCAFMSYEEYLLAPRPDLPAEVCDGLDNDNNAQIDEGYDTDSDMIADCFDNCPDDANASQVDVDGDGIGDACDPSSDPIPFASIDISRVKIRFSKTFGKDNFALKGKLRLASSSAGIFPSVERVTIILAGPDGDVFTQTLRPGDIVAKRTSFAFKARRGASGIVSLKLKPGRAPLDNEFKIDVKAKLIDAKRLLQFPLAVRVVIGDEVGAQTLPCEINARRTAVSCG